VPGSIALPLFRLLRHGRLVRGTVLDPFGWQEDRRLERRLVAQYEADIDHALARLRPDLLDTAAELAELPLDIRGFGPIKRASTEAAEARRKALLARLDAPAQAVAAE
jgi:indolepyruvate ferredoxin oxidoreductase